MMIPELRPQMEEVRRVENRWDAALRASWSALQQVASLFVPDISTPHDPWTVLADKRGAARRPNVRRFYWWRNL